MAFYTVIAVGKIKESFYLEACAEYLRRLGGFGGCNLIELPECRLPERPSAAEIAAGLAKEAAAAEKKIPKGAYLIVCSPEGAQRSSEALAAELKTIKLRSHGGVCFLIGSSFGLDPALKKRADLLLSMSRMTFPHHLFRIMLLEQIYRAENILSGTKYHK